MVSEAGQGAWIWLPSEHKAFLRGHLYLNPVQYVGIPNQSLMIQQVTDAGNKTYPHSSIVKFIDRHVELECAEANEMQCADPLVSAVRFPLSIPTTAVDKPATAIDSILFQSTGDMVADPVGSISTETVLHPENPPLATSQSSSDMDVILEDERIGDALIGVRVRE